LWLKKVGPEIISAVSPEHPGFRYIYIRTEAVITTGIMITAARTNLSF
jgi:hypothetical protein